MKMSHNTTIKKLKTIPIILGLFLFSKIKAQETRFVIFEKSLKENNQLIYQNIPCDIGVEFNESSIKIDLDVYDFWEIKKIYPIVVDGKKNSIEYDLLDLSGNYCKMFLTSSDDNPSVATLIFIYTSKRIEYRFKERKVN